MGHAMRIVKDFDVRPRESVNGVGACGSGGITFRHESQRLAPSLEESLLTGPADGEMHRLTVVLGLRTLRRLA